mmetsp:Transcript_8409/g.23708  ORF Transcript_8409/g.23708 Transcript_8409/m.23708 type:complete len:311 (+) Transcript_8409:1028-1960(+)
MQGTRQRRTGTVRRKGTRHLVRRTRQGRGRQRRWAHRGCPRDPSSTAPLPTRQRGEGPKGPGKSPPPPPQSLPRPRHSAEANNQAWTAGPARPLRGGVLRPKGPATQVAHRPSVHTSSSRTTRPWPGRLQRGGLRLPTFLPRPTVLTAGQGRPFRRWGWWVPLWPRSLLPWRSSAGTNSSSSKVKLPPAHPTGLPPSSRPTPPSCRSFPCRFQPSRLFLLWCPRCPQKEASRLRHLISPRARLYVRAKCSFLLMPGWCSCRLWLVGLWCPHRRQGRLGAAARAPSKPIRCLSRTKTCSNTSWTFCSSRWT